MAVIYLDRPVQEGDPIGSVYDPTRSTLQNNNSLQDFDSFVVTNPDLVDPGIDVSGLRTTTDANILGNISDFPGIQYEAYNPTRLSDLMRLYSSGLPTLATDTAQIPGAIDTLVDVGGGGGMDQVTGGSVLDTAPTGGLTESGTFGGQPTFTTVPGTTVDNVTGNITNPDGSFGGNIVDEFFTPPSGITGDPIDVGIPDNESGFVDPLGTIGGAPVVSPVLTNQGPTIGTVDPTKAFADQTPLTDVELVEQGFLPNISDVTPPGFEPTVTINETPESFIDKTKDFLGLDEVNIPTAILKTAINAAVGKPITFAFDVANDIFSKQTNQDQGVTADDAFDTINEASVNEADVEAGLATESIADIDPADDFEVSGDIADVGTAMDLIGPAPTPQEIPDRNRGDGGGSGQMSDAQAAANQDAARGGQYGGGSSNNGGGKGIVCTMMNESYGFGSFRNKIWIKYAQDNFTPEYEKGYHKIFLPLVAYAKKKGITNKILKTMLEHIAVHRTIDIRQELRGKVHLLGRVYRKILEPICYWVGKHD